MKEADYIDPSGRKFRVLVPDDAPPGAEEYGIHVGPPPLDSLGLPADLAVRLHNNLHARGMFTVKDIRARRMDLIGALQSTLAVDATLIEGVYIEVENQVKAAQANNKANGTSTTAQGRGSQQTRSMTAALRRNG